MRRPIGRTLFSGRAGKRLFALLAALTLCDILFSVYSLIVSRREIAAYERALTQAQMEQVYADTATIRRSLIRILLEDDARLVRAQSADALEKYASRSALIDLCSALYGDLDPSYELFFYFSGSDEIMTGARSSAITMEARPGVYAVLREQIAALAGKTPETTLFQRTFLSGETYYLSQLFRYNGVWIGSLVPAETLLKPLAGDPGTRDRAYALVSAEGTVIADGGTLRRYGLSERDIDTDKSVIYRGLERWLVMRVAHGADEPTVCLLVRGYARSEWMVLLQAAVLVFSTLIIGVCFLSVYKTQRHVLQPLRRFNELLALSPERAAAFLPPERAVAELADITDHFREMMDDISALRLAMYQKQIEQQRVWMEYLAMQIKPHFFLNCMNLVNSMARSAGNEDITRLSQCIVDYLRYVFRSDMRASPIAMEMTHLRNYLDIMNIRYQNAFDFEISLDPAAEQATVPAILLQTFVENCVKHAFSPEKRLSISLSVVLDAPDQMTILLTDNGPGFPPEYLSDRGSPKGDGAEHIGIENARRRLQWIYGDTATLTLMNTPRGGAVVLLQMPPTAPQEEEVRA